jgi:NitT/TauT family transport system permease protein
MVGQVTKADDATAMARPKQPREVVWRLVGVGGFLVLWQIAAWRTASAGVPPPLRVVSKIAEIFVDGLFWPNFGQSLTTIGVGFVIAYTVGTGIGVVMGISGWWDGVFRDWLNSTLMMPGLVVVIVVTMMVGLGRTSAVAAVVLTSVPYAAINLAEGVKTTPRDLLDMSRAFGVDNRRTLRDVLVPAIAPFLFTAARYVFSLCWQTTTLAEVIGGTRGIGFMMKRAFQLFDVAGFIAWCLTFFLFTIMIERAVLQQLVDRAFRWRPYVAMGPAQ